LGGGQVD